MGEGDDERLERLTGLACRVWSRAKVVIDGNNVKVQGGLRIRNGCADWTEYLFVGHPRALDALEAALLVLAQESSPELEERHAKLVAVADKLNSLRRWIEGFAREFEQRAGRLDRSHAAMGKAFALREVAAELRERAKERP